jgi:predicted ferric reductase
MHNKQASLTRTISTWFALFLILAFPIIAAAFSPQLQWRDAVYIIAGFAGIIALCLLLVQPLLIGGYLLALSPLSERRLHRWVGGSLVCAIIVHVAALWITSPPDVLDALMLVSPTPFSIWGVIAMWAVFATAILAVLKKRLKLKPRSWRMGHTALAAIIIIGSVVHALLIEGTMEFISKVVLCVLVILIGARVIFKHLRQNTKVS